MAGTERNIVASRVLHARPSEAGGRGRGEFRFPIDTGSHGEHLTVPWFPCFLHSIGSLEKGQEVNGSFFKRGLGSGSCVCRNLTCYATIIKILRNFSLHEGGSFSPIDS